VFFFFIFFFFHPLWLPRKFAEKLRYNLWNTSQRRERRSRLRTSDHHCNAQPMNHHSLLAAFGPTLHMAKTKELAKMVEQRVLRGCDCNCDWDFCIVINCLICIINNRV